DSGLWKGKAHERWVVEGHLGILNNHLLHFPHQTIENFLEEINFYTDIRASELVSNHIKVYFWSIFLYPLGKFLVNYILKRGFMDGTAGLVFALIMSFHSFLIRGKLWLKKEEKWT
ncbi:MAG: hypothetical protein HY424_00405, partial [Candidatus Levybacteria bacterium]|nr:hypothetical protein [Candidatus Levybacteria bacterium]